MTIGVEHFTRGSDLYRRARMFGATEVVAAGLISAGLGETAAGVLAPVIVGGLSGGGIGGLSSAVTGGSIGKGILHGAEGGALTGGIGGALGAAGGLTGVGNGIGSAFGDATLGTDIGNGISGIGSGISNGLSQFGNATGMSSLFGGTAAPTDNLTSAYNSVYGAPSAGLDAATAASAPAAGSSTLSGYVPSGGAISNAGGGSSGGFYSLSDAGGLNPASGAVGTGSFGDFNSGLNASTSLTDPSLAGATTATKGASMMPSNSLTNGLLKSGLSYALQNNNQGGYNALQSAGNAQAANYQPFLQTGQQANTAIANLQGLNGQDAANAAAQNWQNTPGYQFALNQGINATDASAAARGMLMSGNNQQAVQQYGSGLAGQYYNNYLQNLQQQAGQGVTAAGGVGQGQLNAASAFAAGKGQNASNYNTMLGGVGNALFPSNGISFNSGMLTNNNANNGLFGWLNS